MKAWRKVKMEIKNYEVGDQINVKLKNLGNTLLRRKKYMRMGKHCFFSTIALQNTK